MDNFDDEIVKGEFGFSVILDAVRQNWKFYVISMVLCVVVGMVYTHYKTRIYQVTAKVLLKDNEKGTFSSQSDMLADFGFRTNNSNVENEIEVLNSKSVVQMAVMHSGLYVRYFVEGLFTSTPIYKNSSPVQLTILEEDLAGIYSPLKFSFSMGLIRFMK